ncbi:NADH-quinone oxidoreductase subunit A [bacterium]|nr:MAG: NADH-quinone oxidoreductase subunit A [bacterium]
MLEQYLPILIMIGIAVTLGFILMGASVILGPHRPNITKLSPYESGMDPIGEARERYSVTFYMVAMEFIVFDLEVVFLYPWAVQYLELPDSTFWAMIFFIVVLFVGLVYTLKKGTLDWSLTKSK